MAAAMSSVALVADAWTAIVASAAGAMTIGLENTDGHVVLIRVDANASSGDAATAGADSLAPGEYRTYPLATGDKVFGPPTLAGVAASVTLRTP